MVTSKVNLIIAILMDLPDLFKSCNTKQRLLIKKRKEPATRKRTNIIIVPPKKCKDQNSHKITLLLVIKNEHLASYVAIVVWA